VRPAVSVGRTTALDGFNQDYSHFSTFGNHNVDQHDFGGYLDAPQPSASDLHFFEHGVLPVTDSFSLNFDHMAGHNDGTIDNFDLFDFVHDEQPAPEIQSSDSLAETTTSLQPQFGASSHGCDDGTNAVIV